MTAARRFLFLLILSFASAAVAQEVSVPRLIRFTGSVPQSRQEPRPTVLGVTFVIYKDATGGAPIWIESHNVYPDVSGRYTVLLGGEHAEGLPQDIFTSTEARWIAAHPEGQPEGARVQLISVPYALQSADSFALAGRPASEYVLAEQLRQWESLWTVSCPGTLPISGAVGAPPAEATTVMTGAVNTLAKFTDAATVGSSAVYEYNGKLGIGTATPNAGFHVAGALPRAFIQATTPGNNAGLWFESRPPDTTKAAKRGGVYFSAGNTAQSTFVGFTADDINYAMTANQNGDVGIGTTLASAKLHVAATAARAFVQSTSAGKTAGLRLGGLSATSVAHSGGIYFQAADTAAGNLLALSGDDTNYQLVVTSAGDIGVGTTTPAAKLDVAGNLRLSNGGTLVFNDLTTQSTAAVPTSVKAADTSLTVSTAGAVANVSVANLGITTAKLADASITSAKLGPSAVTSSTIADANVTSSKLAASSVTTAAIANGTITAAKLGPSAVTSSTIADASVTSSKLAASSVTTAAIADGTITAAKLGPSAITSSTIADASVTSSKLAASSVTTAAIANGTITAAKLGPSAVTSSTIADASVTSSKLAVSSVTTAAIADGTITAAKLGPSAVTSSTIADTSVTSSKLAASSVTTAAIADGTITAAKLQSGVIPTTTIADGSITTAKLADGSVTSAKIAIGSIVPTAITGTAATLGSNSFTGAQAVSGTITLSNTAISPAITVSNTSRTDAALLARNTATTGPAYGIRSETQAVNGLAAYSYASATTGSTRAYQGRVDSPDGTAIEGMAYSASGNTVALHGIVFSANGKALLAEATADSGTNYGVYAQSSGDANSAAIFASASNTSSAVTYGLYGRAASLLGVGVLGYATATTGPTSGVYGRVDSSSGTAGEFNNGSGGNILIGRSRDVKVARIDGAGKLFANGGSQVGGADFAESVRIRGERTQYEPGDVLVIDPDHDRQFQLSSTPYATSVAGIYSTKPGVLATPHTMDSPEFELEVPLAMIGIVPCKASAENGPIRRGDLLVTSSIPGHVMLGLDRSRMFGAIVGKALQSLESGTGTIECMVTLQ